VTRAANTTREPGPALDIGGDRPIRPDDQARLIGVDTADAAVLRIRRVMTEALGAADWPKRPRDVGERMAMGNSNDLTVEIDRAR